MPEEYLVSSLRFNHDHRPSAADIATSGHLYGDRAIVPANFSQAVPVFGGH